MKRSIPVIAAIVVASLALAGCASTPAQTKGGIAIVASTSVYGDIATSIVGDFGTVTSIISNSAVDPHSFEASARDQLAIADADLVIANGGGYDPFVGALVTASGSKAVVLTAVDASGLLDDAHTADATDGAHTADATDPEHAHVAGFNEHVWYSMHGMTKVIGAIAAELAAIDPANDSTFATNAAALMSQVEGLEARESQLATEFAGSGVALT